MKVLDPGHYYALDIYDGEESEKDSQLLRHMKREGEAYPGNVDHYSGTNTQEVLRAEIDRIKYVDNQKSCMENMFILDGLRSALHWLEVRANREHKITEPFFMGNRFIEEMPACRLCGHVMCRHSQEEKEHGKRTSKVG